MIIANYMVEYSDLDQVWMVVSPHNPLKKKDTLANDYDRLHLVNLAIGDNDKIKASNIEFSLPKPSYTVDTLSYLVEKYPKNEWSLIMGGDNLGTLHRWKNYEILLERYSIYVYKRPNYDLGDLEHHENVHILNAPLLEISSSFIRKAIKNGKSVQYLLTKDVFEYIESTTLYR
jgi:nicotinate-nucleotide adenylyltransferase